MTSATSILREVGYVVLQQTRMRASDFRELDDTYAKFVTEAVGDAHVQGLIDEWNRSWMSDPRRVSYYSGAPMGFRDRTGRHDRDNKRYLQYCREFGRLARLEHPRLFQRSQAAAKLVCLLDHCAQCAEDLLMEQIRALADEFPGMDTVLTRAGNPAPLLVRLIQYVPGSGAELSTGPHVDKSALTLHMHSSGEERFVLGKPKGHPLRLTDLRRVDRRQDEAEQALFFPGALLEELGFGLPPTPHAALPLLDAKPRHTIVAFWLVPYLSTSHIATKVAYIDDRPAVLQGAAA